MWVYAKCLKKWNPINLDDVKPSMHFCKGESWRLFWWLLDLGHECRSRSASKTGTHRQKPTTSGFQTSQKWLANAWRMEKMMNNWGDIAQVLLHFARKEDAGPPAPASYGAGIVAGALKGWSAAARWNFPELSIGGVSCLVFFLGLPVILVS